VIVKKNSGIGIFLPIVLSLLAATSASAGYKGFARGESLITVLELSRLLQAKDPQLRIIGVVKSGSFAGGHIPTAVSAWRPDYEPPVGQPHPFDGMMLERREFEEFARRLGVDNDSTLVVYDQKYDATRLWWAFFLYGKTDVRVLDGGLPAWRAAGNRLEFGPARSKPGNFDATARRPGWVATMDEVRRAKTATDIQLWDTREPREWSGDVRLGASKRAGRIPWASFQSWKVFRDDVNGHPTAFRQAAEISEAIERFGMRSDADQVFYCQSGVRTTTAIFALYLMGWDPARLRNYDGSWLQWSYYDANPVARGGSDSQ